MTTIASDKRKVESLARDSTLSMLVKYAALCVFDALMLILFYALIFNGTYALASVLAVTVIATNVVVVFPGLYPFRWLMPGIFFVMILVIFPIIYTLMTSLTNFADGNLLSKQQLINQLLTNRTYRFAPEDALTYSWTLFQSETNADDFALWLVRTDDAGNTEVAFAPTGSPIVEIEDGDGEAPETYNGYVQMSRAQMVSVLNLVENTVFGDGDDTAGIRSPREAARPLERKYEYDDEQDAIVDRETGAVYFANGDEGIFITEDGHQLPAGYFVSEGLDNYKDVVNDPSLRGPIITVFIWTVMFAFLSVFTHFWFGLFMALILNDPKIPGKKIIRSLLIVPYAMPGVIGIVVWKGMLNPNIGYISLFISDTFGVSIPWFSSPFWARLAALLVNLWLGYPYMMLVSSGALQAIPSDIYEAASVDGATPYDRFWKITMPLLLVTMGPLLIASFLYNFNNYLMIKILTGGNPPIPGSSVTAGYTDILINYVFNSAFTGERDFGYASAVTMCIFLLVTGIALVQYRLTQSWEEIGENV